MNSGKLTNTNRKSWGYNMTMLSAADWDKIKIDVKDIAISPMIKAEAALNRHSAIHSVSCP
jgi:hypothetical protein